MVTVFLVREQESYKQVLPAIINLIQTLHLISTGIQENIAQLIENLDTASKKYNEATYSVGSKTNLSVKILEKEGRQKESKEKEFFGREKSQE